MTELDEFVIPITINSGKIARVIPYETASRIARQRNETKDVLSKISLYLSVGMGDETTTAKQYYDRILEGIKMLTDPLQDKIKELEEKLNESRTNKIH